MMPRFLLVAGCVTLLASGCGSLEWVPIRSNVVALSQAHYACDRDRVMMVAPTNWPRPEETQQQALANTWREAELQGQADDLFVQCMRASGYVRQYRR